MSFDFNQQYNDDFKLEHTKIENILFWEDEENKFVNADIELFGKSHLIHTYKSNGVLWKRSRGASSLEILEYEIKSVEDNFITIEIGGNILKVDYLKYMLVKKYHEEINSNNMVKWINWANSIKETVSEILEEKEFVLMVINFLNAIPVDLYVKPSLITQVEAYFFNDKKSYGGKLLLISDEVDRAYYVKVETTEVGDMIYNRTVFNVHDAVKAYIDDGLEPLNELIKDRYDLDEIKSSYACYHLLNQLIKTKLSNEWANEFNDYFLDIEELNLSECIKVYFKIDTINYQDVNTAGKFIYYLMGNNKFINNDNFIECSSEFINIFNKIEEVHKKEMFVKKLSNNIENSNKNVTIDDIDLMDGKEFEEFLAKLFNKMGYKTEVTKHSGDQGIDVIAEKNGTKLGIQAKCYSGAVGNSAIQEAVAGKNYYKLDKVLVITNSNFTNSAIELAKYNSVVLWDRNILKEKII